jgi:hypothetical protein
MLFFLHKEAISNRPISDTNAKWASKNKLAVRTKTWEIVWTESQKSFQRLAEAITIFAKIHWFSAVHYLHCSKYREVFQGSARGTRQLYVPRSMEGVVHGMPMGCFGENWTLAAQHHFLLQPFQ